MSLSNKLETIPHREVAGSSVYAAFEFQLMFGVELLFENYDKLDDYAVLFEFHDDIVLLTGTEKPSKIEFFQLKHSTTGNWTLARLSKQGSKGKKQSILQKLQANVQAFSEYTDKAQVVSNTYCSEFGEISDVNFNALPTEKKTKLIDHIQKAFPDAGEDCVDVLGFRRTELDKASCDELVKGRVHSFLQDKLGGDAFQLKAITDTIVSQCRLKNKKLSTDVSGGTKMIVEQKGITKSDLDNWLSEIAINRSTPEWSFIQTQLGAGWGFFENNSVRNEYESYKVAALDHENDAQNSLVRIIRVFLESNEPSDPLTNFIDTLITHTDLNNSASKFGYSPPQVKAMVTYEIFKPQQSGAIQKIDTQPTEEVE